MMKRHSISLVMGGILLLWLAGGACAPGLQAADVKAPSPPVAPKDATKPLPLPVAVQPPETTYEYKAAGKPDPFRPFMEAEPALISKKEEDLKKKASPKNEMVSPLQRVDIDQLRLIGITGDDKKRVAVVADEKAKKYYPIFIGTYIGLNGGRVSAILPDRLVIEEQVETPGKKTKRVQVKQLQVLLHKDQAS
jgi:type IV pilus assembly protein PilP